MKNQFLLFRSLLFAGTVFFTYLATGQPASSEVEEIKRMIAAYQEALAGTHPEGNWSALDPFLADDFAYTMVYHFIDGSVHVSTGKIDDYHHQLSRIAGDVKLAYGSLTFPSVQVRGQVGMVVYNTEYESTKGQDLLGKGSQASIATVKKTAQGWRIVYMETGNFLTDLQKGVCSCELYTSSSGSFVARTRIPHGTRYEFELNDLRVVERDNGARMVGVGTATYQWSKNNEIWSEEGGQRKTLIGKGTDDKEVFEHILRSRYATHCSDVRISN